MDVKHFELLLRRTPFCTSLLSQVWDGLSTLERIDLLLHFIETGTTISEEIMTKAIGDPNPVIRMLTIKCSSISEHDDSGLFEKIKSDSSPLVKVALQEQPLLFDVDKILQFTHIEKLGLIAFSNYISGESFAELIVQGLQNNKISEDEASEIVLEFIRNPKLIENVKREPIDGLDDYTLNKDFAAIWGLTTCTSPRIHNVIAWEYPLSIVDKGTFPDEMLDRMSKNALVALIWRNHAPLFKCISEFPERFDKDIHANVKLNQERL